MKAAARWWIALLVGCSRGLRHSQPFKDVTVDVAADVAQIQTSDSVVSSGGYVELMNESFYRKSLKKKKHRNGE